MMSDHYYHLPLDNIDGLGFGGHFTRGTATILSVWLLVSLTCRVLTENQSTGSPYFPIASQRETLSSTQGGVELAHKPWKWCSFAVASQVITKPERCSSIINTKTKRTSTVVIPHPSRILLNATLPAQRSLYMDLKFHRSLSSHVEQMQNMLQEKGDERAVPLAQR